MIDRLDKEIGRVLDQIRAMGAFEDTLIVFLSDNGGQKDYASTKDYDGKHGPYPTLGDNLPVFHAVGLRALALACESGDASDFYHYGRVLLHGFHCTRDEAAAVVSLRRAARQGHEDAAAELGRAGHSVLEPPDQPPLPAPARKHGIRRLLSSAGRRPESRAQRR